MLHPGILWGHNWEFVFEEKIIHEMTGMPTIKFAERIVQENKLTTSPEELVSLKQKSFREMVHKVGAIEEVVAIVHKHKGKIPMAVGTGASKTSAVMQLETLDILEVFDTIISADDVDKHKPEPDTFLKCAANMDVDPKNLPGF